MADKEIKISFPEVKMEVLEFFLREQNETVEAVLKAHLDKTYEKNVPAPVKKFVESKMTEMSEEQNQTGEGNQTEEQNQRNRTQRQARGQGRRNVRRESMREEAGQQDPEVEEVTETEAPEQDQELETGMTISM